MAAPHVKDCKLFFDESHLCHSSAFDSKLLEAQEIAFTVSFQEQVYLYDAIRKWNFLFISTFQEWWWMIWERGNSNHDGCIRAWLIVVIVLSFLSNCCCVQKVKRTFACCRGFIRKNYRILSSINISLSKPYNSAGREPWSSGHGTRLVLWRL